ncbi:uncharacterized protein LOC130231630 isoform X1 [Danio aesculapii]|uniref:uncharacterized protein LOC130231630 isoform X1 n=1 Tax=Danio aesculapii TaxID=1142201 RepID=UPI0024BFA225|nr:uncharacterized protein LOC130231630 isoform X1 [Danio aesculapii]
MKLSVSAFMLLICTTALLCTNEGQPRPPPQHCQCIKTHSRPQIPERQLLALKVIPAGPHCRNEQIIATLKNEQICLSPTENWVMSLKNRARTLSSWSIPLRFKSTNIHDKLTGQTGYRGKAVHTEISSQLFEKVVKLEEKAETQECAPKSTNAQTDELLLSCNRSCLLQNWHIHRRMDYHKCCHDAST